MRAAPTSEFQLTRFGFWRTGVAVLAAAAAAVLAAWWRAEAEHAPAEAMLGLGGVVAIAVAASAGVRPRAVVLREQAGEWFAAELPGTMRGPFRLDVPIDLGPWMLLRLRPSPPDRTLRAVWIPAQRLGHEAAWHALRRAVYSPRLTVGGPPGAEPHLPE